MTLENFLYAASSSAVTGLLCYQWGRAVEGLRWARRSLTELAFEQRLRWNVSELVGKHERDAGVVS